MNDRFENIAEESMVLVPGQNGLHNHAFSLKKFAEQLILECIDQCFTDGDAERIAKHFDIDISEEE